MVGERDIVEVVELVVGIECAPGAVLALHADDPLARAFERDAKILTTRRFLHAIHGHGDDGGIVDVGIMRIGILERPAAGT